jgi:hypothetical protein
MVLIALVIPYHAAVMGSVALKSNNNPRTLTINIHGFYVKGRKKLQTLH